jgi:hypothetical protein
MSFRLCLPSRSLSFISFTATSVRSLLGTLRFRCFDNKTSSATFSPPGPPYLSNKAVRTSCHLYIRILLQYALCSVWNTGQKLRSWSSRRSFFSHAEWLNNLRCPGPLSAVQFWKALMVGSKGYTTLVERLHPSQGRNFPITRCTFVLGLLVVIPSSYACFSLAQPSSATSQNARKIGAILRSKRGPADARSNKRLGSTSTSLPAISVAAIKLLLVARANP